LPVCYICPYLLQAEYVPLFKKHGYDDTSFIASMTDIDLKRIGIKKRTQRTLLENRIKDLPDFLIEAAVPVRLMSYLRYMCLFADSGVQHILCCVFVLVCRLPVSLH
jgi:chitin synthase